MSISAHVHACMTKCMILLKMISPGLCIQKDFENASLRLNPLFHKP